MGKTSSWVLHEIWPKRLAESMAQTDQPGCLRWRRRVVTAHQASQVLDRADNREAKYQTQLLHSCESLPQLASPPSTASSDCPPAIHVVESGFDCAPVTSRRPMGGSAGEKNR